MKTSSYSDYERNKLLRYQLLMQRRQNIERIFWSRIQILHLIQAGVLGGTFYLTKHPLSFLAPPLLFLGIVLTIILLIICIHDWKDAKRNDGIMHNLGYSVGIRRTAERWYIKWCKNRHVTIKSHKLLYGVVIIFILLDLALLWYFACCLQITCALGWAIASTIILVILVLFTIAGKRFGFLKKEN